MAVSVGQCHYTALGYASLRSVALTHRNKASPRYHSLSVTKGVKSRLAQGAQFSDSVGIELARLGLISVIMYKHRQIFVVLWVLFIFQQKSIFALLNDSGIYRINLQPALFDVIHSPLTVLLDFYERLCTLQLYDFLIICIEYFSIFDP